MYTLGGHWLFLDGWFHRHFQIRIHSLDRRNRRRKRTKQLKELEAEGNFDALFDRNRQITRRLDRQLKSLKYERKLVQSELKKQLLQVAETYSNLKEDELDLNPPKTKKNGSKTKRTDESELDQSEIVAKTIELAYWEVLKIDLENEEAREYFREKGTLDEAIAKLKAQGFPKSPVAKNVHDRKLGLPPQKSEHWGQEDRIDTSVGCRRPAQQKEKG